MLTFKITRVGGSIDYIQCDSMDVAQAQADPGDQCEPTTEAPFTRPIQPTSYHEWDWGIKQWVLNIEMARAAKKSAIEAELGRRLYLPCNGFDADKVSRERISGMIARLQRGDGLPAGWVGWRDASNQQQWATDDAATVLTNLTALSRAIEDREQALLVASWTHKANIAALTDIDAIIGYDVTANWLV